MQFIKTMLKEKTGKVNSSLSAPALSKHRRTMIALEPRIMFDGAAVETAVDATADSSPVAQDTAAIDADKLAQAAADVAPPAVQADPVPQPQPQRTEVVFIESNVADYQTLVNDVKPGTEVHVLDASQDGLAQMAQILEGRSGIDAISIVSHGFEGSVNLGTLNLTSQNIKDHAADLATIGSALSRNGDILLYGCDVAKGSDGAAFISALAQSTQADAAASNDLTGAAALGGDWALEAATGVIETGSPFVTADLERYGSVLTIYNVGTAAELATAIANAEANPGADTINLTADITLTAELSATTITQSLTINGQGHTLSGNDLYSGFYVQSTGTMTFTLQNTTIEHFNADSSFSSVVTLDVNGGSTNETLLIQNSTFRNINATNSPGVITVQANIPNATVIIDNSTFYNITGSSGNATDLYISNVGSENYAVTINNSAFYSSNTAGASHIVLNANATNSSTTVTLNNTTVAGGYNGIEKQYVNGGSGYNLVLNNSIVAGNSNSNVIGTINTQHNSITATANVTFVNAAGGDYRLDNSVTNQSNAINQGSVTYVQGSTDVRGMDRTRQGTVDIGAYESQYDGTGTPNTGPALDLNGATAGQDYTVSVAANATTDVSIADVAATVTQPDSELNLTGLTVALTGILNAGNEKLSLTTGQINTALGYGITVSGNSTATLTLAGGSTLANYQTVLRQIVYNNIAGSPTPGARTITVTGTDDVSGTSQTTTLTIAAPGPTFTSGTTANFAENGTGTVYTAAATASGGTVSYSLTGGADQAKFSIDSSSGVLTFGSSPNFENPTDVGTNNVYDVIITATDSNGTATKNVAVTVTNVNEAPSITSATTASFAENGTGTVYTATGTDPDSGQTLSWSIGGTDAALFSINSSTGVLTFNSAPNYEAPADNGGNNVYDVTVTATDNGSGNLTASQALAITVNDVNEAPVNTKPATQTTNEDTALVFSAGNGNALSVTDQDAGTTLTTVVSVASGKGTLAVTTGGGATITGDGTNSVQIVGTVAQVQAALAAVTYTPTANANGAGYATLTIASTDNGIGTLSDTDTVTIDVTAIADTPSITSTTTTPSTQTGSGLVISRNAADSTEVTYFKITNIANGTLYKNDGTTQITANSFITYAEANAGLKFTPSGSSNGTFDVQASTSNADGGLGGSVVTATVSVGVGVGSPTVNEDTDTGAIAIAGNTAFYKITAITGGSLYSDNTYTTAISAGGFIATGGATTNVYFRPTANFNGAAGFSVQGSSSSGDGGLTGNTVTSTITVNAVNDAPIRTADSLSSITVNEDSANSTALTLGISSVTYANGGGSDESGQTLTYTITAIPSFINLYKSDGTTQVSVNGTVSAAELQGLTYKTIADANGTGNITWTVVDTGGTANGGVNTLTENLSITVTAVNDAPTNIALTASTVSTFDSNGATVGSLSATDVDNVSWTFTIISVTNPSSTDVTASNLFSITGPTLSAASPSTLAAGSYTVRVQADDGGASGTYQKDMAITVSNSLIVTTNDDTGVNITSDGSYAADLADGGGLSLREAIALANNAGGGTIGFASGIGNISLGSDITVSHNITFDADTVGTLAVSGNISIASGKTLTVTNNTGDSLTLSGDISGAGNLTKTGAGTLTLSGTNSYSGNTTVAAGTLSIGGDSNLGSDSATVTLSGGNLTITAAATIDDNIVMSAGATITNANAVTLSGNITGNNALTKDGVGELTLSGTNVLASSTVIGGTLKVADSTNLGAGGVTLNGGGLTVTGSGVTVSNAIALTGDGTITNANAVALSGIVSGTGALTKAGAGTLTLSGDNTYSGATAVTDGTLVAAHNNALGTTAGSTTVSSGASLGLQGGVMVAEAVSALGLGASSAGAIYNISGTNTLSGNVTLTGASFLGVASDQLTISGNIGGGFNITKAGAGMLVLSGSNSYNNTTVSAGTLSVAADGNLGSGAVTLNGGDLTVTGATTIDNAIAVSAAATLTNADAVTLSGAISGAGGVTKSGAGTLTLSSTSNSTATATLTVTGGVVSIATDSTLVGGAVTLNGGSLTVTGATTIDNAIALSQAATLTNANDVTLSGALSGSGALTKAGAGKLTLDNTGNSSASATLTVTAGTVAVASDSRLVGGAVTLNGGTLNVNNAGTVDNAIVLEASNGTISVTNGASTLSGNITGTGSLTKTGGQLLTLSGTNTYSGGTTVRGAGMSVTSGANLGTGAVALESGLTITGTATVSNAIALNADATITNANAVTLSGVLSGSNALTKAGAGTLTLSGANTHTGAVTVSAGGLTLEGGSSIGDSSAVTVDSGATLTLNGGNETIGSLAGAGNVVLSYKLTAGGDNTSTTFSGAISSTNTSGLTKTGSGTLTLSGSNTYTGTTTVSAGGLTLSGGSAIADSSAVTVASGATLTLSASETIGSLAGTGSVTLGANTLVAGGDNTSTTFSGAIGGTGGLTKAGSGTLTLSGGNTYTGGTTVSAGSLTLDGGSAVADSSAVTVASGATLTLSASETIGSLAGAGSVTLGANTLTAGGDNTSTTFSGAIGGTGGLTKTGAGTLILSGGNTYTGSTTVSAGSLTLSGGSAVADSGAVTVASGATLTLSASETIGSLAGGGGVTLGANTLTAGGDNTSTTFSGAIGGTGGLTKAGSGTLTLSGTHTYSGTTTVSAGTLSLTGTISSATTVASTATLTGTGTVTGVLTIASGGTLAPGIAGAGTLTVNGNLAIASGGTLSVDINGTTAGSGYDQVVVNGTVDVAGATLSTTLGYTPVFNDSFRLIDNDNSDTITGTFSSLAEGARILNTMLQASYIGGTNNDMTLTLTNDAPTGVGNLTLAAINEDTANPTGTTISALTGYSFQDPNVGATSPGVLAVGNAANAVTEGVWQYSSDGGANWKPIGAVSDNATALALANATQVRFVPVANYNGTPPALSVRALDNTYAAAFSTTTSGSETRVTADSSVNGGTTAISGNLNTISISITAVNDMPAFTKGADQTVNEDVGAQTVNGWATGLGKGPANEADQTLSFTTTNNNNALFSVQPTIDSNGNLTYTPAANANGTATVTVSIKDSGGTANGGVDTSITQTFTITVNPVNDLPTGTVTIIGTPSVGITLSAANTLADVDGLGTISYQWQADGINITGATGSSYMLTDAEAGKTITVVARYTDAQGGAESVASVATDQVEALAPINLTQQTGNGDDKPSSDTGTGNNTNTNTNTGNHTGTGNNSGTGNSIGADRNNNASDTHGSENSGTNTNSFGDNSSGNNNNSNSGSSPNQTIVMDMKLTVDSHGNGTSGGTINLPSSVFAGLNTSGTITITGTQSSGQSLPSFISVNPSTGAVTVKEGAVVTSPITVKVTIRDSQGKQVVVLVKVQPQKGRAQQQNQGQEGDQQPDNENNQQGAGRNQRSHVQQTDKQLAHAGKPGLTQQLQRVGSKGFELQRQTLLDSLASLVGENKDAA